MSEEIKFINKTFESKFGRIKATQEFIERNKFVLNKTQEEIIMLLRKKREEIFDESTAILMKYLDVGNLKEFIYKPKDEEDVKKIAEYMENHKPITNIQESAQDFLDYLSFGWEKAINRRGISASRTIDKLSAWLWLMGRDDLYELIRSEDLYNPYGTPALVELGKRIGIESPAEVIEMSNNPE